MIIQLIKLFKQHQYTSSNNNSNNNNNYTLISNKHPKKVCLIKMLMKNYLKKKKLKWKFMTIPYIKKI